MKLLPLPIGLFLLATIAVDLAVAALESQPGRYGYPSILPNAMLALVLSQVIATAVWLGIGRVTLPLRAVIVFFILFEWNAALCYTWDRPDSSWTSGRPNTFEVWFVFSTTVALYVAAPLLTLRLFGLRLLHHSCDATPTIAAEELRPLQFSIRCMFGLMTALAIIMGMLQFVLVYGYRNGFPFDPEIQWRAALHATIGWVAVWVMLGNVRCFRVLIPKRIRKHWVRIVACLVAVGLIGWIGRNDSSICSSLNFYCSMFGRTLISAFSTHLHRFYFFPSDRSSDYFYNIYWDAKLSASTLLSLEAFLLLATLWVFRRAGYRLTFRANVTAVLPDVAQDAKTDS